MKTYHDSGSVAICQSSNNPGESPGFLGSAESPGDTPEPLPTCHEADKPPLTNRGGIINSYLTVINRDDSNTTRRSIQPWWSAWLQSTEKIKLTTAKEIKTVEKVMTFIKRQYAPSFAMINEHLGGVIFYDFIKEVLKDGSKRMGAKHEQMLLVAAQGKADNYKNEDFEERAAIMEYDGGMDRDEAEKSAALQDHGDKE